MVSIREFVRAWQSSDSVSEVARKVGGNYRAVCERARTLRRRDVPLRDMRRIELEDVRKLASELAYSRRGA